MPPVFKRWGLGNGHGVSFLSSWGSLICYQQGFGDMSEDPLHDLEQGSGSVPLCLISQTPLGSLVPHSLDVCLTKQKEIQD